MSGSIQQVSPRPVFVTATGEASIPVPAFTVGETEVKAHAIVRVSGPQFHAISGRLIDPAFVKRLGDFIASELGQTIQESPKPTP